MACWGGWDSTRGQPGQGCSMLSVSPEGTLRSPLRVWSLPKVGSWGWGLASSHGVTAAQPGRWVSPTWLTPLVQCVCFRRC